MLYGSQEFPEVMKWSYMEAQISKCNYINYLYSIQDKMTITIEISPTSQALCGTVCAASSVESICQSECGIAQLLYVLSGASNGPAPHSTLITVLSSAYFGPPLVFFEGLL